MNNRVFVGNLSFSTTEDSLRDAFAQFGDVVETKLVTDRDTGRSRGFAFVEMASPDAAAKAIEEMDGQVLDGRSVRVNMAEPRREGGGGGGGGGGRGGFSRDDRGGGGGGGRNGGGGRSGGGGGGRSNRW
jgi:RNA recognition motif-containing protein